jgi:hypothetical protein
VVVAAAEAEEEVVEVEVEVERLALRRGPYYSRLRLAPSARAR